MLPISNVDHQWTNFLDAFFTATSSTCVTGLVVKDTGSYWSNFGHIIILLLIQIGGMGVVTVAMAIMLISRRKISLRQRNTLQEALSAPKVGGIVKLMSFIIKASIIIEIIGALFLMPSFMQDHGLKGIWYAIYHSISAFCNAGFDILGSSASKFGSLTSYQSNWAVNITVCALIIVGGLGFMTWDDIYYHGFKIKKYRMQSKVILTSTLILILLPFLFYFFHDYTNLAFSDRFLFSMFQSITPRTAGFNTADLTKLSDPGKIIMMILMLIGGAPGSTAGGMKITTIAVLYANAYSVYRRDDNPHYFNRRLEDDVIKSAATIFTTYISLCFVGAIIISIYENLPIDQTLFECASAIGTVGLTLGITPSLNWLSKIILILMMFFVRVGALTFIYATTQHSNGKIKSKLSQEKITVG